MVLTFLAGGGSRASGLQAALLQSSRSLDGLLPPPVRPGAGPFFGWVLLRPALQSVAPQATRAHPHLDPAGYKNPSRLEGCLDAVVWRIHQWVFRKLKQWMFNYQNLVDVAR
jgi:hypothetical protein